jgi:hypothetical protein
VVGVRRRGRVVLDAQKTGQKVRFWETMLIPEVQDVEAEWMARSDGSRWSRGTGIPRRSCVERLRDPVANASVVLVLKQR